MLANVPAYCQEVTVEKEEIPAVKEPTLEEKYLALQRENQRLGNMLKRIDRFCPKCGVRLQHGEK
jgi:hypothetical protein